MIFRFAVVAGSPLSSSSHIFSATLRMWSWVYGTGSTRILHRSLIYLPSLSVSGPFDLARSRPRGFMEKSNLNNSSSFSAFASSSRSGGRGRGRGSGSDMRNDREGSRGRGGGGRGSSSGGGKINALGRLLTSILRHKATELNLNMRNDGYVKVQDLLKLNKKTFADIPLRSHTVDEVREAVRVDNKQRFSLLEENGELLIRANQGHSVKTVETESLLQPILSADEVPVCVHGTYRRNLDSILASGLKRMNRLHVHFSRGLPRDGNVISGMRRDVNILIFLDVRKALEEGMKLYISDNQVILTEGFNGGVPVKYFEKIESWPDRRPIPFSGVESVMDAFAKVDFNKDVESVSTTSTKMESY